MTDYARRRDGVRGRLEDANIDALLVTSLSSTRYLTGFSGSSGGVVVALDPAHDRLITDFRYQTQVATECPDIMALIERTVGVDLARHTVGAGYQRVGFEKAHLSVADHERIREVAEHVTLVPTEGIVETSRTVKDDDEIAAIAGRHGNDLAARFPTRKRLEVVHRNDLVLL